MQTKTIRIAILAEEPLGWWSGKHYFKTILDTYHWTKNHTTYQFHTTYITDTDIRNGKLTPTEYPVLLVPGGGVGDGEAMIKGIPLNPKTKQWKQQLTQYIQNGGSYVGICGGAALLTDLHTNHPQHPPTIIERLYQRSSLHLSNVTSYYPWLAMPLFYPFQYTHPEHIGATGYVFSFAPGKMQDGTQLYCAGVPINIQLDTTHPIFQEWKQKEITVRWWGGPALQPQKKHDTSQKTIAKYPKKDFSTQETTQINAWSYTGGLIGLIKGFIHASQKIKKHNLPMKNLFILTYFLAQKWEKRSKPIVLDFADKPCITVEEFPQYNHSRIVLCTTHPEYYIWHGGAIKPVEPLSTTCLADGLHQWTHIEPFQKDGTDELTQSWWMIRRFCAWAAKIPNDHMPPINKESLSQDAKQLLEKIFYDEDFVKQLSNI